jgi:hypothetical protein
MPVAVSRTLDRLGAGGSLLCAIHCALLPALALVLPSLSVVSKSAEDIEWLFVIIASVVGLTSLLTGYRRHGSAWALLLLVPGLAALWAGLLHALPHDGWPHAVSMTAGGALIGAAHLANLRLHRAHVHDAQVHSNNCNYSRPN